MPLHTGVVYGPIRSRRLGFSLGVNLLPPGRKVCTFNCVYCQYGWTGTFRRSSRPMERWPLPADVANAVQEALGELAARRASIDRITLAGHGEPTLHPQFAAVVEALRELRDAYAPGVALAVLSNSSTAHRREIADALARLDERYMKLDAGDQDTLRHISAVDTPIGPIVDALATLRDIVIQALFVDDSRGRVTNTTPRAVEAWLRALQRVRPEAVHLYTVARATAWAAVQPAPLDLLEEIATRVRAFGLKALVFP